LICYTQFLFQLEILHFSGIYIINRCYLPCIYIKTPLTNTKWNIELVNRHKKHVFISNVNKVEWFIYKEVVCIVIVRRIINHYKFWFIINSYYSKLLKMHAFIKYSFQKKIVIQYFLFLKFTKVYLERTNLKCKTLIKSHPSMKVPDERVLLLPRPDM
jgi:hypothetical protein